MLQKKEALSILELGLQRLRDLLSLWLFSQTLLLLEGEKANCHCFMLK